MRRGIGVGGYVVMDDSLSDTRGRCATIVTRLAKAPAITSYFCGRDSGKCRIVAGLSGNDLTVSADFSPASYTGTVASFASGSVLISLRGGTSRKIM